MDILYLLIPMSAVAVLAVLGLFAWALNSGQFDDLDTAGAVVLELDRSDSGIHATPNDAHATLLDRDQGR